MKLELTPLAMAVALLCVACSGGHDPVEVVNPIPLPEVPARYVSESVVVPEELEDEFAALVATPYPEYWHFDPTTFEGEMRRAAIYWRFSRREAVGNAFWLHLDATDRAAADDFIKRLVTGWELQIVDSSYSVVKRQSHNDLFRTADLRFSKGETAWLCEWLYLNYPQFFVDVNAHFHFSHSEGSGESI